MNELEQIRTSINEIDEQMARLFEKRMIAVKKVAEYKLKNQLPIFNASREEEVIIRNQKYIEDKEICEYYLNFIQNTMDVSKQYQKKIIKNSQI